MIMSILRDARYAFKGLLRSPAFAAVTILTLGLGIGATTAVFSVVNGVLLRPLPYDEPEELVGVWHTAPGWGVSRWLPWDRAFGRVAERYAVIVEFGFDNDQTEDEFLMESSYTGSGLYRDDLMDYIEARDLSWTVWVFSHDWKPRMLLDTEYTPSELGRFVKEDVP